MIKNFWFKVKNNKMFVISIIAILFIPVLYAGNFITAFADPYNRMSDVDVAIVNEDKTIINDGSEVNVGNDFVSNLKESERFKWHFVSEEDANLGMKNNKYYFTIKIPENFTSNIYSTINGIPKDANLIYMANDNNNYISDVMGGILVKELNSELNKEIVNKFLTTLGTKLDGVKELSVGVTALADGTNDLTKGINDLVAGSKTVADGAIELSTSSQTLAAGTSTLNNNYKTFNASLSSASDSLSLVTDGYNTLNGSLAQYEIALESSINASGLPNTVKTDLINNYKKIASSSAYLNTNLKAINTGTKTLKQNSNLIASNIDKISNGNVALSGYLSQLNNGTKVLFNGTQTLYNSSLTFKAGVMDLRNGVNTFNTSITNLNLTKNATNLAAPVNKVDEPYKVVKNYGYGFAPYFISLGLFVGALVTTIVIAMKDKKKAKSKGLAHSIKRIGLYTSIVISQTLILDIILLTTQLSISNVPLFVTFTILIALMSMAIIQMLSAIFGDAGRFACIILLILQLTSCGGTFPIETSPKFYNVIHNFMPMTYTVDGLRAVIGNGNMAILGNSVIVLLGIILVCSCTTIIYFKNSKKFS